MRRVLVTGSREWTDYNHIRCILDTEVYCYGPIVLVHGDCYRGADALAHRWFINQTGESVEEKHPADWRIGKAGGHIRNQQMVNLGADVCHAFPTASSRGTVHCMKAAEAAGIPVVNHGTA